MFESSDTIPILLAIVGVGGVLAGMAWRMAARLDRRITEDKRAADADRRAFQRARTTSGPRCSAWPSGSPVSKDGSTPPGSRPRFPLPPRYPRASFSAIAVPFSAIMIVGLTVSRFIWLCCRQAGERDGGAGPDAAGHPVVLTQEEQHRLHENARRLCGAGRLAVRAPGGEEASVTFGEAVRFLRLAERGDGA